MKKVVMCEEFNLEKPEAVTTTKLQKYIATVSQILDLQENEIDWLACHLSHDIGVHTDGEQECRSGESARLPPMWPGFDSRTQRHMWVEFVVSSRPCSEGFSPSPPVFLPPQKLTFLNSNSTWNLRATGLSVARLLSVTLVK